MCLHFDTKDEFVSALAVASATESLAKFVAGKRFEDRTDAVIKQMMKVSTSVQTGVGYDDRTWLWGRMEGGVATVRELVAA